ncbi:MAG: putative SOS response-associated peptidase YedK [Chloroflexi bacterium]|jgi:putative SOS response-associated peptidase YedK|nr:MAG: putative SOS response-associated peptidase YedK [Chloroflexota bacterium]
MCGRFTLYTDLQTLQARFQFNGLGSPIERHYNIAPTQEVLVVRNGERDRTAALMRWGLVPAWAEGASPRQSIINARGEEMAVKPAFRDALVNRRCLVLANGFYEWWRQGNARVPVYFTLRSEEPFAFAGLWEERRSATGALARSCTIITTRPNALMEPIHNRMPAILHPDLEEAWLDPTERDPLALTALVSEPYRSTEMAARPVSKLVNSARFDTPDCIVPATDEMVADQPSLF